MSVSARLVSGLFASSMMALIAGCTSDGSKSSPAINIIRPIPMVDPQLAHNCSVAAANKYYLPTRVIQAVDSTKATDGSTIVQLKVDIRTAVCTVNSSGSVRSVVDTSPKSDDQIAAEKAAAEGRQL